MCLGHNWSFWSFASLCGSCAENASSNKRKGQRETGRGLAIGDDSAAVAALGSGFS